MKKIVYKILIVFVIIAQQSCNDFVDIEPRGKAIASTLEDVNLLLNNGSEISWNLHHQSPVLISDNIEIPNADVQGLLANNFDRYLGKIYSLAPSFYRVSEVDEQWRNKYRLIGLMNHVLATLDQIEGDQVKKDQYTGEALVHRAFNYWSLVNVYGHHYGTPQASQANSGVPIVTVFGDETVPLDRKSTNEVYDFILNDLNKAVKLLQVNTPTKDRPRKASAYALLARVYLHMGNYAAALDNANKALAFNSTLNNYGTTPPNNFGEIEPPVGLDNPEHVLLKESFVIGGEAGNNFVILARFSPSLVAIFDTNNDLRINGVAQPDFSGSYTYGLFNDFFLRNNMGVTTPELYLIKAEVLARQNNIAGAMAEVNKLRANRFTTAFVNANSHVLTAANQAAAIQHVIDERRREFHVQGMRFFDIKRLNAIENANISLTRGTTTYTANSINWALPIDQNVVNSSNGQITQNPRE